MKFVWLSLLLSSFTFSSYIYAKTDDETAIRDRIAPVGQIKVAGKNNIKNTGTEVVAKVVRSGKEVFDQSCSSCHGTGVLNAPKPGDKAWIPRKAQGMDILMQHALQGFNAMPPRGACGNCSDDDIAGALNYMLEGVE